MMGRCAAHHKRLHCYPFTGGTVFWTFVSSVCLLVFFSCFSGVMCCVCVFSSFSFRTSSSLDVPAGVTQEEGHTGFLIHLLSAVRAFIFLARRIQPFISLVDREVECCVLTIKSFSTRWAFLFLHFSFLVRKIPFAGIELTSQRVRRLGGTSELPGRPVYVQVIKLLMRRDKIFHETRRGRTCERT